jgi:hypothetical protein
MMLAASHVPLSQRVEVILVAVVVCLLIFELIRRKHLMERYAILWLGAALTVLVLGIWQGLLTTLAHAVGIDYPPSALFAITFLFVLVMLVHFSTTVSRLAEQNKMLAQRLALLRQRVEGQGAPGPAGDRESAQADGEAEPGRGAVSIAALDAQPAASPAKDQPGRLGAL